MCMALKRSTKYHAFKGQGIVIRASTYSSWVMYIFLLLDYYQFALKLECIARAN